jgi:AbrB family looped-hinge helix DNA binding protein
MLITIDKRGSISLPVSIRKELGFLPGTHLELTVKPGGAIVLHPIEIYRTIKLNNTGLLKLDDGRKSDISTFPEWFLKELTDARADTE